MICPCNPNNLYKNCCQKAHNNIESVISAEELMRSRYSAFVLANGNYLMSTHHKSTRPNSEKKAIVKWAKSVEWIKLDVQDTTKGLKNDNKGTVTFSAYFYDNGTMDVIHEKSAFVKENNHWFYLGYAND